MSQGSHMEAAVEVPMVADMVLAMAVDMQLEHAVLRAMVAVLRKGRIAPLVASAAGVAAQAVVLCRMWAEVRGSTYRKRRTSTSGTVEILTSCGRGETSPVSSRAAAF